MNTLRTHHNQTLEYVIITTYYEHINCLHIMIFTPMFMTKLPTTMMYVGTI